MVPHVPTRMMTFAPPRISPSNETCAPAAPTPWDDTVTGTPLYLPLNVQYSRDFATTCLSSRREAIFSARPGSPHTMTRGAMVL